MISKLICSLVIQVVPIERTCHTCNPNCTKKKVTMIQQQFKMSPRRKYQKNWMRSKCATICMSSRSWYWATSEGNSCMVKRGQRPQRVRSVVHVFARISFSEERPLVEQHGVPSYSGFQWCLLPYTRKSKANYILHTMKYSRNLLFMMWWINCGIPWKTKVCQFFFFW